MLKLAKLNSTSSRTLFALATLSIPAWCTTTRTTELAPKGTPDACLAWEAGDYAASPEPETVANTQDTDQTVAWVRKQNARHDRYCR